MPYLLKYVCFSQVCYKVYFSEGNCTLPVIFIIQLESVYWYISFMRPGSVSLFFFLIMDIIPGREEVSNKHLLNELTVEKNCLVHIIKA